MRRTMAQLAAAGAVLLSGLVAFGGAPDAGEDASGPALSEVMARLGSSSLAERDLASDALVHGGYSEEELLAQLRGGLDIERANRVRAALFERFSTGDRGALGIRYDPMSKPPVISEVLDTHPAGALGLLKANDQLVSIDGVVLDGASMPASLAMRASVVSKRPGDLVTCVVERGGERVEVELPLGSWSALQPGNRFETGALSEDELRIAWAHRMARLGCDGLVAPPPAVQVGLGGDEPVRKRRGVGLSGLSGMVDEATLNEAVGRYYGIAASPRRVARPAQVQAQAVWAGVSANREAPPRLSLSDGVHTTLLRGGEGPVRSRAGLESVGLARELARLELELSAARALSASSASDPSVRQEASERGERLLVRIGQVRAKLEAIGG